MTIPHDHGEALRALLHAISPLPEVEWQWLQGSLRSCTFARGKALYRVGSSEGGIHFLRSGLVRYFYLTEAGTERNHGFAGEGNLVGCFPVLVGVPACPFCVEALEPTETVHIPAEAVRAFSERHSCWAQLWIRVLEHVALRKAAREEAFLLQSAQERYRRFVAEYPQLAARIPQYHVASYLGITPVALSRIRRRINRG